MDIKRVFVPDRSPKSRVSVASVLADVTAPSVWNLQEQSHVKWAAEEENCFLSPSHHLSSVITCYLHNTITFHKAFGITRNRPHNHQAGGLKRETLHHQLVQPREAVLHVCFTFGTTVVLLEPSSWVLLPHCHQVLLREDEAIWLLEFSL